jgi:hypothetical protein
MGEIRLYRTHLILPPLHPQAGVVVHAEPLRDFDLSPRDRGGAGDGAAGDARGDGVTVRVAKRHQATLVGEFHLSHVLRVEVRRLRLGVGVAVHVGYADHLALDAIDLVCDAKEEDDDENATLGTGGMDSAFETRSRNDHDEMK